MKYVVRNPSWGKFLMGHRWVSEYPDADQFDSVAKARKAALAAMRLPIAGGFGTRGTAEIIANYGLSTESVDDVVGDSGAADISEKHVLALLNDRMASGKERTEAGNEILNILSPGPPFDLETRGKINDILYKSKAGKKIVRRYEPPTKWKVNSLDVWGNEEDGFEVNNEFEIATIEIPAMADDAEILKIFKEHDLLSPHITSRQVEFDEQSSEGFFAVIEKKTQEPVYHVYEERS